MNVRTAPLGGRTAPRRSVGPLAMSLAVLAGSVALCAAGSLVVVDPASAAVPPKQAIKNIVVIYIENESETNTFGPSSPATYLTGTLKNLIRIVSIFALEQAGLKASDLVLSRALTWLRTHQNADGYWPAESMNHKHAAGTVPEKFMSDAATGYATAALLAAGDQGIQRTASNSKPRN